MGGTLMSRGARATALGLLCMLLLGAIGVAPARAAGTFDPKVTVSRSTDAARAATSFGLTITQTDGQEQIGPLSITLPRNPGFTVNTDAPGDRAQIGTIRAVLYTDPGRARLTIDGTLHDDNYPSRGGCGPTFVRQCIIAFLNVPGYGNVEAELEIHHDPDGYRITGDLTDTWNNDAVAAIDGRLAELSTTLAASVGNHTVVRNPATSPGPWAFKYDLTSASGSSPRRTLTGDLKPPCAASNACRIDLATKEYAPSAPPLQAPEAGGAYLVSTTPTTFTWGKGSDRNGDSITYTLVVDGTELPVGAAQSAQVALAPGQHVWQVRATDDQGDSTLSGTRTLTVIDPTTAQVFTSAISNDKLYVVPGAFLYKINGSPASLGAETASATPDRGSIVFSGRFTLAIAYDAATATAAGYLNLGSTHRVFADPPGA